MEPTATGAPAVAENPAASRYELLVEGKLAGFVAYRLRAASDAADAADAADERDAGGQVMSLVHTEVEPAFQGQHLATQLARYSLDDARKRGLAVLPFCPYINSWIKKHPEYADLVPVGRRADFGLA